jgi:hypothetical protein
LLLYLPYYPALILIGFFPWVMFLPAAMRRSREEANDETARLWRGLTVTWFWVVLVAFTLLSTKLPGYVTPLFPAMALLVGAELDRRWEAPGRGAWVGVAVGAVAMVLFVWRLLRFAPELGARVGAAEEVGLLVIPLVRWGMTYAVISVGAVLGGSRHVKAGIGVMIGGQTAVLMIVFAGVPPVVCPYMEGAREYQLAQLAQRKLPGAEVVLYDSRPEAVCFVVGHPVRVFGRTQPGELARYAQGRRVAVIASAGETPTGLKTRRRWQVGNGVLIEVRR